MVLVGGVVVYRWVYACWVLRDSSRRTERWREKTITGDNFVVMAANILFQNALVRGNLLPSWSTEKHPGTEDVVRQMFGLYSRICQICIIKYGM